MGADCLVKDGCPVQARRPLPLDEADAAALSACFSRTLLSSSSTTTVTRALQAPGLYQNRTPENAFPSLPRPTHRINTCYKFFLKRKQ